MKYIYFSMVVLFISTTILACSTSKVSGSNIKKEMDYSGPPSNIYKTNKDYSQLVPVTLSADKSKIVSYPSPKDIYYKGKLAYPFSLINDYYLDNRGVNEHTAFLSISYEEYAKLTKVPPLTELYAKIIDKNPFKELYNCGNRYRFKDEIPEINKMIMNGELKDCKCIIGSKK